MPCQIGPELYGTVRLSQQDAASPLHATGLEALLGVRARVRSLVLGVAGGAGLTEALGVPEARFIASFQYVFSRRVLDRDGDLLDDVDDRCPDDPGMTEDGCPAPDRDGDSILEENDACPDRPGLAHADPERNGCPPAVDSEMNAW